MDTLTFIADPKVIGPWVFAQMGDATWSDGPGRAAIGALVDDKALAWGVVYERFTGRSLTMHTAIADGKRVTRAALGEVFRYPFETLGVQKVLAEVNSENPKSRSLVERLGFVREAVVENVYLSGDMWIYTMERNECRWLRGKHHGR